MLKLPKNQLIKLKCAKCEGYLNNTPITINKIGQQICGKCFNQLEPEESANFHRQIGLEIISELVEFPCKYENLGCNYTFRLNQGCLHEENCHFKYSSIEETSFCESGKNFGQTFLSKSDELEANFTYKLTENKYLFGDHNIQFKLVVQGHDYSAINIETKGNKIATNCAIELDGVIALKNPPEMAYSNLIFQEKEENIYDSLSEVSRKCYNCSCVYSNESFQCLFGHTVCKNCKGNYCVVCARINGKSFCKNYIKGCKNLHSFFNISKHENDCEFNTFRCLLEECCDFIGVILADLKSHMIKKHSNVLQTEKRIKVKISHVDKVWYWFAFNQLFLCKYYFYEDFIEVLLIYVGAHDNAYNYNYSVVLSFDSFEEQKKSDCLGWNLAGIDKGVNFHIRQCNTNRNKFQAELEVNIQKK